MGFTEMTHAFIVVEYYRALTDTFGERGKSAFIHAAQYYGAQRGRRMAQRAIRNGETLTFDTYSRYGEWVNTEEVKALGIAIKSEVLSRDPHLLKKISVCPWHTEFVRQNCLDGGTVYCTYVDEAICRGFNPSIEYSVYQNMNSSDSCLHMIKNCFFSSDTNLSKHMEYVKDFAYHCGHLYFAFREVVCAIFGKEGIALSDAVMIAFQNEYGKEMANALASFEKVNFNVCD